MVVLSQLSCRRCDQSATLMVRLVGLLLLVARGPEIWVEPACRALQAQSTVTACKKIIHCLVENRACGNFHSLKCEIKLADLLMVTGFALICRQRRVSGAEHKLSFFCCKSPQEVELTSLFSHLPTVWMVTVQSGYGRVSGASA